MKRFWSLLSNRRGEVATGITLPAITPEQQEQLKELDKLKKDNANLGFRLRANEKFTKDLGEQVQYDSVGNPIGIAQAEPAYSGGATDGTGGAGNGTAYPFQGVADQNDVGAWLQTQVNRLISKQGFITQDQLTKLQQTSGNDAYRSVRQEALFWRSFDQMVVREIDTQIKGSDGQMVTQKVRPYEQLNNYSSDFSKSVARKLQEKKFGNPMGENAASFATDWQYIDPMALEWAADLVRLDEGQAGIQATQTAEEVAEAAKKAAAAQGQAAIGDTSAGVGAGGEPVKLEGLATSEDVLSALDAVAPADPQ